MMYKIGYMQDQIGLFQNTSTRSTPLAHRVRPINLDEFVGQQKVLERINKLNLERIPHIVFFGPPGSGKTTLAQILASKLECETFSFSAVLGGVKELREIIAQTELILKNEGKKSVIFIDEIHRFNKAQQDALLPHLEDGKFILLGATTEYPQTSLNQAILSRVQTWRLEAHSEQDIEKIIIRVLENEEFTLPTEVVRYIALHNNGDARSALNQIENLLNKREEVQSLDSSDIIEQFLFSNRKFDRNSERHYDVISAFIKSVRGSDVDAALLWLAVMLDGGEDIDFIARRLMILASEDIGNADPRAIQIATSVHYTIKQIGMPEARIPLAQATTYLAKAPKSNASYLAINKAMAFVKENPTIEVPTHLRNHHPDKKNYLYPHSYPNHHIDQEYMINNEKFYKSSGLGYEKMQEDYQGKIKS